MGLVSKGSPLRVRLPKPLGTLGGPLLGLMGKGIVRGMLHSRGMLGSKVWGEALILFSRVYCSVSA